MLQQLMNNQMTFRDAIKEAEEVIRGYEQINPPVKHHFSKGVYAREIFMPEGMIITGRIHKTEHICVLFGDIEIGDENGTHRYTGYHVFNSLPGTKRILITHADTVFTTVHVTDETNIEKLEVQMCCDTYEEFEEYLKLGGVQCHIGLQAQQ